MLVRKKSDETADERPLTLRERARGERDISLLDDIRFEARVWMRSDVHLERLEKRSESVKATMERSIKHVLRQSYP